MKSSISACITPSRGGFAREPGGVRYCEDPIDPLPNYEAKLAETDRVASAVDHYLTTHRDAGLLTGLAESAGKGQTRVAWMIYALRHLQHHVAQLSAGCKRRGLGAAAWE